jgi:hypothetical protein
MGLGPSSAEHTTFVVVNNCVDGFGRDVLTQ